MNSQIIKWFQNNEFCDRKAMGTMKQRSTLSKAAFPSLSDLESREDDEDSSTTSEHLIQLQKELKKKKFYWDTDKIARLLSLTYQNRAALRDAEKGFQSRIATTMATYPCFQYPLFVSTFICCMSCDNMTTYMMFLVLCTGTPRAVSQTSDDVL